MTTRAPTHHSDRSAARSGWRNARAGALAALASAGPGARQAAAPGCPGAGDRPAAATRPEASTAAVLGVRP
jgi:hypothetical protein